ncbi:MAG TPA: hypothetical protein VM778_02780 [Gemmatimonadota bacterium]|nr:hypothetical protein [Gemmatimonadota bacterium]
MIGAALALLGLWVLLAAVWLAVWPFFRAERAAPDADEVELRDLRIEKERLLGEIHELELDWETGKLSDEDYRALEARLKGRAIEVMREIDVREAAALERRSRAGRRKRQDTKAGDEARRVG